MRYKRERQKKNLISFGIPEIRVVQKTESEFDGEKIDYEVN